MRILPHETIMHLPWAEIEPFFAELNERPLNADTVEAWLADWSRLRERLHERAARLRVASVQDTADEQAETALKDFLSGVFPEMQKANNALTNRLLESGLQVDGMEVPLRKMRQNAAIFREANLPLQTEEQANAIAFNKITAAQTITWEGEEFTTSRVGPLYEGSRRETRRAIWALVDAREQQDRVAINELWVEVLANRQQQAANAGFPGDYRAYAWRRRHRFDYSPQDCRRFHAAIEKVVVPAAGRVYQRHTRGLGVDSLRPWDLDLYQQTYPISTDHLTPFNNEEELLDRGSAVFHRVDPALGGYYDHMRAAGQIDFVNRPGKGPGAFCTAYPASRLPFMFGNAVGQSRDVTTLLHESGHAFHNFESFSLPYYHQRFPPMEFNEVASMAMEFLGAPYLTLSHGGYYTSGEAALARTKHLEKTLLFWPYMAVVDAFQHWVYENPEQAADPADCDRAWGELWDRFIPWIDFTGLESAKTRGWHRKRHIHRSPFYYIEYGLASLGAVQIWANARRDQAGAVQAYRSALALGGTVGLKDLYEAAGAHFAFDAGTLQMAVDLIEEVLDELAESQEADRVV